MPETTERTKRQQADEQCYNQTGLRAIAEEEEAIALWHEHGGRCLDEPSGAFIHRIETDRYGADLPRGSLLLYIDGGWFAPTPLDGDLCLVEERADRASLRRIEIGAAGDYRLVDPANGDDALPDDAEISDTLAYCGLILFDAQGQAKYRPANRYARAGYELIGEQRSRARGGGRGENSPGASTPEG